MASTFGCSFLMYRALDEPNSDVTPRSMALDSAAKNEETTSHTFSSNSSPAECSVFDFSVMSKGSASVRAIEFDRRRALYI